MKLTSGRKKRGVAEDYDTSKEEGLGVTDEDTTFCMKDENCLAVQYCDKTQLKVYGTCEFHSWFWVIIALAVTVTVALITVLLWFWFKKIHNRNTSEESGENCNR